MRLRQQKPQKRGKSLSPDFGSWPNWLHAQPISEQTFYARDSLMRAPARGRGRANARTRQRDARAIARTGVYPLALAPATRDRAQAGPR
ncbi:MAG: hypothetical protein REJ50_27325, partial [Bordetella sp.]|nr:hypothetical protein [Bordetella sp.]